MNIIYQRGNRTAIDQMDWEAQEAVKNAIEQVKEKRGFKTYHETWVNCSLIIRPDEKDILKRDNWHNGSAYYCNGVFWASLSRTKVELI
jgi:hypothetical protein